MPMQSFGLAADLLAKKPTKKKRWPYVMNRRAQRLAIIEDAQKSSPAVRSVKGAKKALRRAQRELERQYPAQ